MYFIFLRLKISHTMTMSLINSSLRLLLTTASETTQLKKIKTPLVPHLVNLSTTATDVTISAEMEVV